MFRLIEENLESGASSASNRILRVTLLSSEWRSTKGGLSTINRELAIQLATHSNVEVSMYLPQCTEDDKTAAAGHKVRLIEAEELIGYDPMDWLTSLPETHHLDCIIGHGLPLGRQVQVIQHHHHCKWIQVMHTAPEGLGMFKSYVDPIFRGEKKHLAELKLCELADLVVAVGPKLTEEYSRYLRYCQKDKAVFSLTPSIFSEFSHVTQATEERKNFCVLVFGRGDEEDFKLKGYDIAATAIAELKENSYQLIFVGVAPGKEDGVAEKLCQHGIDRTQLTVRSFKESREELVRLFCEVDLVIMPSRAEGFGLAALEALSAGLPVLVSGNSGFGDALKKVLHGSNCVVDSEDPKEWAKAIKTVRRKDRDVRLGETLDLRGKYAEKYSWEEQCGRLVEKMFDITFNERSNQQLVWRNQYQGWREQNSTERHNAVFQEPARLLKETKENVSQEDELLKALEDKYDALREKLLLEALEKQVGYAEWGHLSEEERQARLAKLELQERRLRQQGRFDDAAALLGEGLKDTEALQALLGENRERYLERLKERLERRQKRLEEGLDPDEEDEEALRLLNEEQTASTGNILRDLQNRFDKEKDALLRRLQEEQDRLATEKRRQAELARLRREKRQAERESKFDEAALVLGLAERNRQNLEERLPHDRERQEQLAWERLARRKRRGKPEEEEEDEAAPDKDDKQGWQDAALKSLETKHRAEQEFLMSLLQDESSEGMREEATAVSEDKRLKCLNELKAKREGLNFGAKADQRFHVDILDMAAAYKFEVQRFRLTNKKGSEVNDEQVTVSIMADLQEEQDKESERIMAQLQEKNQAELAALKQKQEQERKDGVVENVATVLLEYDGTGSDNDLIKALDEKYDALKDKLLLEALKKQLGEAEWAALSKRERQKRLVKLKLEERRLRKEGQADKLQKVLGEGFEMDANLKKLMGENKARYEEKLKERLARRRERLAQGLPPDDEDEEDLEDGEAEGEQVTDVKAILEDLDKRYEEEKDALMRRLQGQDEQFMSEKQRQAELTRLKRERRKAKQEDNFSTAALVVGLAEKQKAAVEERPRQDRLRQEQLARERLAQLRSRRKSKEEEAAQKLVTDGDVSVLQEAVMKALEHKHQDERQALLEVLQQKHPELAEAASTMTQQQREIWIQQIKSKISSLDPAEKEARHNLLLEAAVYKIVNRQKYLEASQDGAVKKNDVIVSLLADLQQEQDQESEKMVNEMQDKDKTELVQLQEKLFQSRKEGLHQNVVTVVTQTEIWGNANEHDLSRELQREGKQEELQQLCVESTAVNLMSLTREELKAQGSSDEEIAALEAEEDAQAEDEALKSSTGNTLQDLEQNERLACRREERERKKAEEEEERKRREEEEAARKRTEEEEEAKKKGDENKPQQDWPLPGGFAVSEEKQREIVSSLIREHTNAGMKFEQERTRQVEMIKARKESVKTRIEQEQEVVATIISSGEMQKTFVQQQKKEERERQNTMNQERIARVRHERSMAMREPKDEKAQGFESLLSEEEKQGLSEEEKMERIAAKMEEKFKSETRRVSIALAPPGQSLNPSSAEASDEDRTRAERSSHVLDEKSRERKLKERMASRKKERRKSAPK